MLVTYTKADGVRHGFISDEIISVISSLESMPTSREWHDYVAKKFEDIGFNVQSEFVIEEGRVDLVISKHDYVVAIELDNRTPRKKSILKIKTFKNGLVLLRDPKTVRRISE